MFTDLTWQHQVLSIETILSALIGLAWLPRYRRTVFSLTFFLAWNLVLFALLITGARHSAWQYWVLFGWYVFDSAVVAYAFNKIGEPFEKPGGCFSVIFSCVMAFGLIALIVTGN